MIKKILLPIIILFTSCHPGIPQNIGVSGEKLQPCPNTNNCISTFSTEPKHKEQALPYKGSEAGIKQKILDIIGSTPRTTIIKDSANYIHAEYRTALFKYIDDVEFLIDDSRKLIHYRSASRVGKHDLGANRKRMRKFGERFYGLK